MSQYPGLTGLTAAETQSQPQRRILSLLPEPALLELFPFAQLLSLLAVLFSCCATDAVNYLG